MVCSVYRCIQKNYKFSMFMEFCSVFLANTSHLRMPGVSRLVWPAYPGNSNRSINRCFLKTDSIDFALGKNIEKTKKKTRKNEDSSEKIDENWVIVKQNGCNTAVVHHFPTKLPILKRYKREKIVRLRVRWRTATYFNAVLYTTIKYNLKAWNLFYL